MNSGLFKMTSPLFSIIIPTYNSANTLVACLESILDQSFQNFEIIIVDGVSADDTISIVKHHKEINQNIRLFSEKDNGIYDAMNKGVKIAKGEWLYFLGSDDYLFDNDVLMNVERHIVGANAVFFYGNVLINGNTKWAKHNEIYAGRFSLQDLMQKNICHQAIFYNKKIIDRYRIRYKLEYPICADWDFNLNCWSKGETIYVPLIVAVFCAGGESTQIKQVDTFGENFLDCFIEYFRIRSYWKLKRILVPQRIAQLNKKKGFQFQYKLDNYLQRYLRRIFNES